MQTADKKKWDAAAVQGKVDYEKQKVDYEAKVPQFSIQEHLLRSNEKQFQGGLVSKARRLLYHSTLGRE